MIIRVHGILGSKAGAEAIKKGVLKFLIASDHQNSASTSLLHTGKQKLAARPGIMAFFCLRQQAYTQLVPQENKLLRRTICKIEDLPNDSVQQQESKSKPEPASASCCCCNQNEKTVVSRHELTAEDLLDTFPRFGPAYRKDPDPLKAHKDDAWNHIQNTNQGEVWTRYLYAIKKIETDAKKSYAAPIRNDWKTSGLKNSDFRWMMIIDGCFFLQLVLHILGSTELLGHSKNHPYFGSNIEDKVSAGRIKAMFFVGNQIPRTVIRTLMKQHFFQNVIEKGIAKGTWKPPSDLPKMALYLLVVHPELEERNLISSLEFFSKLMGRKNEVSGFRETPTDLLHALHCLVQGPGNDPLDSKTEDSLDVEVGVEDLDRNNKFPSATELKKQGIGLTKAKEGIREIHFGRKNLIFSSLYIPPFTFDDDTEPILQYLQSYEIQQNIGKGKREVNAYVRFMADLIQTQKDVRILESKGIIQVKKREHKDTLPGMLRKLVSPSKGIVFTQKLRLTRAAIEDYSPLPRDIVSVALLFGLVQTVFTILQYFEPRGLN